MIMNRKVYSLIFIYNIFQKSLISYEVMLKQHIILDSLKIISRYDIIKMYQEKHHNEIKEVLAFISE